MEEAEKGQAVFRVDGSRGIFVDRGWEKEEIEQQRQEIRQEIR